MSSLACGGGVWREGEMYILVFFFHVERGAPPCAKQQKSGLRTHSSSLREAKEEWSADASSSFPFPRWVYEKDEDASAPVSLGDHASLPSKSVLVGFAKRAVLLREFGEVRGRASVKVRELRSGTLDAVEYARELFGLPPSSPPGSIVLHGLSRIAVGASVHGISGGPGGLPTTFPGARMISPRFDQLARKTVADLDVVVGHALGRGFEKRSATTTGVSETFFDHEAFVALIDTAEMVNQLGETKSFQRSMLELDLALARVSNAVSEDEATSLQALFGFTVGVNLENGPNGFTGLFMKAWDGPLNQRLVGAEKGSGQIGAGGIAFRAMEGGGGVGLLPVKWGGGAGKDTSVGGATAPKVGTDDPRGSCKDPKLLPGGLSSAEETVEPRPGSPQTKPSLSGGSPEREQLPPSSSVAPPRPAAATTTVIGPDTEDEALLKSQITQSAMFHLKSALAGSGLSTKEAGEIFNEVEQEAGKFADQFVQDPEHPLNAMLERVTDSLPESADERTVALAVAKAAGLEMGAFGDPEFAAICRDAVRYAGSEQPDSANATSQAIATKPFCGPPVKEGFPAQHAAPPKPWQTQAGVEGGTSSELPGQGPPFPTLCPGTSSSSGLTGLPSGAKDFTPRPGLDFTRAPASSPAARPPRSAQKAFSGFGKGFLSGGLEKKRRDPRASSRERGGPRTSSRERGPRTSSRERGGAAPSGTNGRDARRDAPPSPTSPTTRERHLRGQQNTPPPTYQQNAISEIANELYFSLQAYFAPQLRSSKVSMPIDHSFLSLVSNASDASKNPGLQQLKTLFQKNSHTVNVKNPEDMFALFKTVAAVIFSRLAVTLGWSVMNDPAGATLSSSETQTYAMWTLTAAEFLFECMPGTVFGEVLVRLEQSRGESGVGGNGGGAITGNAGADEAVRTVVAIVNEARTSGSLGRILIFLYTSFEFLWVD